MHGCPSMRALAKTWIPRGAVILAPERDLARGIPGSAGVSPAVGRRPTIVGAGGTPALPPSMRAPAKAWIPRGAVILAPERGLARGIPGSAGVSPAVGRRPTIVGAGGTPALPPSMRAPAKAWIPRGAVILAPERGLARGIPGSAGVSPAVGRRPTIVGAGGTPALPGDSAHVPSVRGEALRVRPSCRAMA